MAIRSDLAAAPFDVSLLVRGIDGNVLCESETWAAASDIDEVVTELVTRGKLPSSMRLVNDTLLLEGHELLAELADSDYKLQLTAVSVTQLHISLG